MKMILRTAFAGLLAVATPLALGAAGCATGSSATKNTPVELNGTTWKMVVAGGRMDGRVINFKKKGIGYTAVLMEKGHRLRDVTGLVMGDTWVFSLKQKGTNEYEGVYREISPDGGMNEKEVLVFVDGDSMNWNLETVTWERQR